MSPYPPSPYPLSPAPSLRQKGIFVRKKRWDIKVCLLFLGGGELGVGRGDGRGYVCMYVCTSKIHNPRSTRTPSHQISLTPRPSSSPSFFSTAQLLIPIPPTTALRVPRLASSLPPHGTEPPSTATVPSDASHSSPLTTLTAHLLRAHASRRSRHVSPRCFICLARAARAGDSSLAHTKPCAHASSKPLRRVSQRLSAPLAPPRPAHA